MRHLAQEIPEVVQVTLPPSPSCSAIPLKTAQGMIRSAVGQGRQILAERFPQFRDLVCLAHEVYHFDSSLIRWTDVLVE